MTFCTVVLQLLLAFRRICERLLLTEAQQRKLIARRKFAVAPPDDAPEEVLQIFAGMVRLTRWVLAITAMSLDLMVLLAEWDTIAEYFPCETKECRVMSPLSFLSYHVAVHGYSLWCIHSETRHLDSSLSGASPPWQLGPMPLHPGAWPECPIHDTCGICLENLCEASAVTTCCLGAYPECSISASRSRRRSASPGISARRSHGSHTALQLASTDAGSDRKKLATLRCGHSFHEDCIKASWAYRSTCPTCRLPIVERPPAILSADEVNPAQDTHDIWLCFLGSYIMSVQLVFHMMLFHFFETPSET